MKKFDFRILSYKNILTLLSLGFLDPCRTGGGVNIARGQLINYNSSNTYGMNLKLIPHTPWLITDTYVSKGSWGHVTTCCNDVITKISRTVIFSVWECPFNIFFVF